MCLIDTVETLFCTYCRWEGHISACIQEIDVSGEVAETFYRCPNCHGKTAVFRGGVLHKSYPETGKRV